jgi:hypothetical protein
MSLLGYLNRIGNELSKYLERTAGQSIYRKELGLWNPVLASSTMVQRGTFPNLHLHYRSTVRINRECTVFSELRT